LKVHKLKIEIKARPDKKFSLKYNWGFRWANRYEESLSKKQLTEVLAKLIDETDWD